MHGLKINRLFFTQGFVGQQIDLKKYSKPASVDRDVNVGPSAETDFVSDFRC